MPSQENIQYPSSSTPFVSVVIAADHDTDRHADLQDLRSCLQALATQTVDKPVEYLLVETPERVQKLPDDLTGLLPGLKVLKVSHEGSYERKNAGVEAAVGEIVAILDADCTPDSGWLQILIDTMKANPQYAAVSGRTMYQGLTVWERCFSILSRGFLDPGKEGPTRFISNNNNGAWRTVYKRFPFPESEGPYAAQLHSAAILRGGERLLFQPAMVVTHDFEGWEMERDIRKNIGWATIRIRQINPSLRFSWLLHLGWASVPLFYVGRVLESWYTCFRLGRQYGLKPIDYPVAVMLTFYIHYLEITGMLLAFRHKRVEQTKYR